MRPTGRVSTGVASFTKSISTTSRPLVARRYEGGRLLEGWVIQEVGGIVGKRDHLKTFESVAIEEKVS